MIHKVLCIIWIIVMCVEYTYNEYDMRWMHVLWIIVVCVEYTYNEYDMRWMHVLLYTEVYNIVICITEYNVYTWYDMRSIVIRYIIDIERRW